MSPDGKDFRDLTSSSYKYGLTKGSYVADFIELTPLGIKITKPRNAAEKTEGLQEAVMIVPLFNQVFTITKMEFFLLMMTSLKICSKENLTYRLNGQ